MKKRKKMKWVAIGILSTLLLSTTAGCSSDAEGIKVKENSNVPFNKVAMQKMDVYKDIEADDWFNDEKVLTGSNKEISTYNLKTKQLETLFKNQDMGLSSLSPDKKHLFYCRGKKDDGSDNTYYILDFFNQKSVKISFNGLTAQAPKWEDNRNVIIADMQGEVFEANVNGKVTDMKYKIKHIEDREQNYQLVKVKDQLFFMADDKLYVWNSETRQTKSLMSNSVAGFTLSPDKTRLAVLDIISDTGPLDDLESFVSGKTELVIMNLEGKIQSIITKSSGLLSIDGVGWSPDSKKIAYGFGQGELYVTNITNPHPILLAVNIPAFLDFVYPVMWSPSGNKLAIPGFFDANDIESTALYVITLKP